jgi:hypothetical protein
VKPSVQSNGVATKDIRPSTAYTICDVCGRTLLRGERSEVYIASGVRREVCELCKPRALHEGWLREGTVPTYDGSEAPSRRRGTFLSRLRRRRERESPAEAFDDIAPFAEPDPGPEPRAPEAPSEPRAARGGRARQSARETARELRKRAAESAREPRHVRAVPMGAGQKMASAMQLFNGSEHRRTVAGVARSLGAPTISVHPNEVHQSVVEIVASWELCWYRYEVFESFGQPPYANRLRTWHRATN